MVAVCSLQGADRECETGGQKEGVRHQVLSHRGEGGVRATPLLRRLLGLGGGRGEAAAALPFLVQTLTTTIATAATTATAIATATTTTTTLLKTYINENKAAFANS